MTYIVKNKTLIDKLNSRSDISKQKDCLNVIEILENLKYSAQRTEAQNIWWKNGWEIHRMELEVSTYM